MYSGRNTPDVVTRVAERELRQVVGAEAEEVGDLRDLVGGDRRTRDLDHGADLDLDATGEIERLPRLADRLLAQLAEHRELLLDVARAGS
jgi:hypothetical protein